MSEKTHVCPVWMGYLLASPVRKLFHNPDRILGPHISPGMTVVDVGCAMGFFTIPAARMVGDGGSVVAVDLQPKMLEKLTKRAAKAGVSERIQTRSCSAESTGLQDMEGRADVVLAIAMVHEVPDPEQLINDLARCLKPGGRLLIAEPAGHVSEEMFKSTLGLAAKAGLELLDTPRVSRTHSACLTKPAI